MPLKNSLIPKKVNWKTQLALKTYYLLIVYFENYKIKLKKALVIFKKGLANESEQTKQMLKIYLRKSKGAASPDELREANKQFVDLFKGAGLGVFIFLPFSPITLPLIIKLGERLGVDVLPDSFKQDDSNE